MNRHIWAIVLILSSFGAVARAAEAPTIGENDYQRLVDLHSPVLSPNGKSAAVVTTRIVWNEDQRQSDLILIDLADRSQRTLIDNRKGLSALRHSLNPDGSRIAFLAEDWNGRSRSSADLRHAAAGRRRARGHARQSRRRSVRVATRRPGVRICRRRRRCRTPGRGPVSGQLHLHDRADRRTQVPAGLTHYFFLLSLEDGTTTQLTAGLQSAATGEAQSTLSWSPDGKTIAFTIVPNAILNDQSYSRVALLDVATKNIRYLTDRAAWEGDPLFSPDGAHIGYSCAKGDPQVNLSGVCVTTPAGGQRHPGLGRDRPARGQRRVVERLREFVRRCTGPDGSGTLSGAARGRARALGSRRPERCIPASRRRGPWRHPDIRGYVERNSRPSLFERSASGAPAKLTDFNAPIAALDLASAQRITFPTTTGIRGDGVLYLPPGFSPNRKYPLVAFIHGGPDDP